MGADLYIEKVTLPALEKYKPLFESAAKNRDTAKTEKLKAKWQEKVSKYYDKMYPEKGYFRDSYNGSCVMWTLNLSWWTDIDKFLDEKGHLTGEKLSAFIKMVESAQQKFEKDTTNEAKEYYVEKRKKLLAFLKRAKRMKTSIRCSL
jgi:hypothetical protein